MVECMQLALARDMPHGRAMTAYDPKSEFGEPLPALVDEFTLRTLAGHPWACL